MDHAAIVSEEPVAYGQPPPEDVLRLVHDTVKNFPECFWSWERDAPIKTREEVREVVRTLRMNGGHRAWWAAQRIHKCL
jgi:hypothetical protein